MGVVGAVVGMSNLELSTIDELIDELKSRFDDCVIIGRKLVDPEERTFAYRRGQKGEYESVTFLLSGYQWRLHQDYEGSERDPEPWEEL